MNILSVACGVVMFTIALLYFRQISRLAGPATLRPWWIALSVLTVFFLLGYVAFLMILIAEHTFREMETLTAQIFFWGAVFVLLCAWLFHSTLSKRITLENELTEAQALLVQAQNIEAMGRVAGSVAHDFNNVLMAIIGYAEIGAEGCPEGSAQTSDFHDIREIAAEASNLTRQLLAFSRSQILQTEPCRAASLIEDQRDLLVKVMGADVEVSFELETEAIIDAESNQLERVILNLALNAKDAMPNGGQLTLRMVDDTSFGEQSVLITVSDTGEGMSKEVMRRVFEPFFTTKEAARGSGLGLATAYGVVHQHRGQINVVSAIGEGTTFKLRFPVLEAHTPKPSTLEATSTKPRQPLPLTPSKILVVDDNVRVLHLTGRLLESSGYEVQLAHNAEDALATFAEEPYPDLLLSDIVMPRVSGPALAEILLARHPQLKLVYMTGYAPSSNKLEQALASNAMVCAKPFTKDTLKAAIEATLHGQPAKPSRVLSAAPGASQTPAPAQIDTPVDP
jgi:two-component system, cell cycle sensor histidine kinase and response regulator CckA